jgi:DNA-binding GntR family transcriptional regulator
MAKKVKIETNGSMTLIDEAYRKLKEMIFRQNVIPGQRLIAKDLSEILKMSRTPIINALCLLEREGFIVSVPYRGFYVKPVDIQETIELFEVREALELQSVQLAIKRMEPGDMEKLEDVAQKHRDYMPLYYDRQKIALGTYFHIQIAKMSKNKTLEKLLTINMEHEYLRYKLNQADPARMKPAVDEHYELIEKMKKKDTAGCMRLLRRHIRSNQDHIIRLLEQEEKDNEALFSRM